MALNDNIINGLHLLQKYTISDDSVRVSGDFTDGHVIFIGVSEDKVIANDRKKLQEWSWDFNRFYKAWAIRIR